MSQSTLFLTCFVACLFALIVVVLVTYQLVRWALVRAIHKNLPEFLTTIVHGAPGLDADPAAAAELAELMRKQEPPAPPPTA